MAAIYGTEKVKQAARRIWYKLTKQPEKGFIVQIGTEDKTVTVKGKDYPVIGAPTYNMSREFFITAMAAEYAATWAQKDENKDKQWTDYIKEKQREYKMGNGTVGPTFGALSSGAEIEDKIDWWRQKKAHLSPNRMYYVVPLVFDKVFNNSALKDYIDPNTEKLKISDGIFKNFQKEEEKEDEFLNGIKRMALQKLALNLSKALTHDNKQDDAANYGFFPIGSTIVKETTSGPEEIQIAEHWYMEARGKEYQRVWIKVLFDKDWIDGLPNKTDSSLDFTQVTREVMIFAKDFHKQLEDLKMILYHLDVQLRGSNNVDEAYPAIDMSFDANCTAGKVDKIFEVINNFLIANGKPDLTNPGDAPTNAAIQFGFTEGLGLQYVAYSDMPDCLCDQENLNAYTLKKGIDQLKNTPPIDQQTINGFLYYLPEITSKYAKYFKTSNKKAALFGTEQSWVEFIQTYVYPETPIIHLVPGSDTDDDSFYISAIQDIMANPVWAKVAGGDYIKDPMNLLSQEIKDTVLAASNVQNINAGDGALMEALHSELLSMTALYDQLLNRIPMVDLIKMAAIMIFKCIAGDDLKKRLCKMALENIPIEEIRIVLYPCLMELGEEGEAGIIKLEEQITGRKGMLYEWANERFPDKFPQDGEADAAAMAQMTKLYCADPNFASKLGRSPDDFNHELAAWVDDSATMAICDCAIELYGKALELYNNVQDLAEDIIDAVNSEKSKAKSIEMQATISLERIFMPFYNGIIDFLDNFGKMILNALVEMVKQIIVSAVLVTLQYVKAEILGNLMKDLCGGKGFSGQNFGDFIMGQELYKDKGEFGPSKILEKFDIKNLKGYFGEDIQRLWDSISSLHEGYSPSEIQRIFTTPCNDNSANSIYQKLQADWADPAVISKLSSAYPGIPLNELLAASETTNKSGTEFPFTPQDGTDIDITKELNGLPSVGDIHDFCNAFGKTLDRSKLDQYQQNYLQTKQILCDLCTPGSGFAEVLAASLGDKDVLPLTEGEQDKMWKDLESFFPLIDPQRMQDNIPPMFCGPCTPRQRGMEPLMPKQTHETQVFAQEKINRDTYKIIDEAFNNDLSVYKGIITETAARLGDYQKQLLDEINKLTIVMSGSNPPHYTANIMGIMIPDQEEGKYMGEDGNLATFTPFEAMSFASLQVANNYKIQEAEGTAFVAGSLRDLILKIIETDNADQITSFNEVEQYAELSYEIPNTPYHMYTIFNFGDKEQTFKYEGKEFAKIKPGSIKIIVMNTHADDIDYEWPKSDSLAEEDQMKNFDMNSVPFFLMLNYQNYNQKVPADFYLEFTNALSAEGISFLKSLIPIASSYIFETVFLRGTQYDLFNAQKFSNLPLTNEEAKKHCIGNAGATPLLDTEKMIDDVNKTREALECVISFFDNPDAVQISNIYGLYKMMIKICIIEECLKNIFAFGFIKISDVLETNAYMDYMLRNIKELVDSGLGESGYSKLLEYSEKIVNGRYQLGQLDEDEDLTALKSKEQCLEILVKESALEISDIFDNRVKYLVDPEWEEKMIAFQDIVDEGEPPNLLPRFIQYAINPVYMDPLYHSMPIPSEGWVSTGGSEDDQFMPIASIPAFINSVDETFPFPIETPMGEEYKYNGGLFFEPYIRVESKLEGSTFEWNAENAITEFWVKFKKAYYLKKERLFGNKPELVGYSLGLGSVKGVENSPPSVFAGGGFGSTAEHVDHSYKLKHEHGKYVPNFNEGLVDTQTHEARQQMYDFIDDMIGIIDDADSLLDSPLFLRFFKTFFAPMGPSWNIPNAIDWNEVGMSGNAKWLGRSLSFIVSSLAGPAGSDGYSADGILGKDLWTANYHNVGTDDLSQDSSFTWLNGHYWWQNSPLGGYIEPGKIGNLNYANRGCTSFNLAGIAPGSGPACAEIPGTDSGFGPEIICNLDEEGDEGKSMIASFYYGKSRRLIRNGVASYEGIFTNLKNLDANLMKWTGALPGNDAIRASLGELLTWEGIEFEPLQTYLNNYNDSKLNGGVGAGTAWTRQYQYEAIFWSVIRDTCLDSPFDLWFDFSLGMRLNLVVPVEQSGKLQSQLFSKVIDEAGKVYINNIDAVSRQKYIDDKAFIIKHGIKDEKPPPGAPESSYTEESRWMCIPLDSVEFSAEEFCNLVGDVAKTSTASDFSDKSPWGQIFYRDDANQLSLLQDFNSDYMGTDRIPTIVHTKTGSPWLDKTAPTNWTTRPTLWAISALINHNTMDLKKEGVPDTQKGWHRDLLGVLKAELSNKILGMKGKYGDYSGNGVNPLLSEIMPIKESILTTVFLYRYSMQATYPKLDTILKPVKDTINTYIEQYWAAINGDYSFMNDKMSIDPGDKIDHSTDPAEIANQFFVLILQMAANMIDPTWKTPWFLPGPLTPVGMIAKGLSYDGSDDKDVEDLPEDVFDQEECE